MKKAILKKFGGFDENSVSDVERRKKIKNIFIRMRLSVSDGSPVPIHGHHRLFIGSIGCVYNQKELHEAKITHILSLTDEVYGNNDNHFTTMHVNVADDATEDIQSFFASCFKFIESAILENDSGRCLIHCYQGISRSVTIVCAYLMRYHGMSAESSLALVRETRPCANPNSGFYKALWRFEEECRCV